MKLPKGYVWAPIICTPGCANLIKKDKEISGGNDVQGVLTQEEINGLEE